MSAIDCKTWCLTRCSKQHLQPAKKSAVGVNQRKLTLSRSTELDTLRMLRDARMTGLAKLRRSAWRRGEGPVRAGSGSKADLSECLKSPDSVEKVDGRIIGRNI